MGRKRKPKSHRARVCFRRSYVIVRGDASSAHHPYRPHHSGLARGHAARWLELRLNARSQA